MSVVRLLFILLVLAGSVDDYSLGSHSSPGSLLACSNNAVLPLAFFYRGELLGSIRRGVQPQALLPWAATAKLCASDLIARQMSLQF